MFKKRIKSFYNTFYGTRRKEVEYEGWAYQQNRIHSAIFRLLHLSKSCHILEIGCGVGLFTRKISKWFQGAEIIGIDISSKAVSKALKSASKMDKTSLNFVVCDGAKLPLRSEIFDLAICSEVLEHLPGLDKHNCMGAVSRVIKPCGLFIITTPNPRSITLFIANMLLKIRYPKQHIHPFRKNLLTQVVEEWLPPKKLCKLVSSLFEIKKKSGVFYSFPLILHRFLPPSFLQLSSRMSEFLEEKNLFCTFGLYQVIACSKIS